MKLIDLTSQTFGKLKVLKRAENRDKRVFWLCKCECGNIKEVSAYNLKSGKIKSCGCLKNYGNLKHGLSKSHLYKTWQKMKNRCYNKNNKDYKYCGAVGIKVCKEWINDFQNFYDWAKNNGYKQDLFIDRIDKSKNYEPSNCRFVTRYEQSRNKSSNKYITFNGKTMTVTDWSLSLGLGIDTVARRLREGWSVERALTEPHNGTKNSNVKSLAQMKRYLTNNYM